MKKGLIKVAMLLAIAVIASLTSCQEEMVAPTAPRPMVSEAYFTYQFGTMTAPATKAVVYYGEITADGFGNVLFGRVLGDSRQCPNDLSLIQQQEEFFKGSKLTSKEWKIAPLGQRRCN